MCKDFLKAEHTQCEYSNPPAQIFAHLRSVRKALQSPGMRDALGHPAVFHQGAYTGRQGNSRESWHNRATRQGTQPGVPRILMLPVLLKAQL